MIYLIDDNQQNQRLNNYNITFVDGGEFKDYLTAIEKIEQGQSFSDISHLEFLNSAACILLHSTTEDYNNEKGFLSASINNAILIKEEISKEGEKIPLVLFSNSMGEAEFDIENNPNYIRSLKKNLFYERLFDFLEVYKNTGRVELRILAWGKNFASNEVSRLAFEILSVLDFKNKNDELTLTDLSDVILSLKSFLALSEQNVDAILIEIEDNPIKIQDFKIKINRITESYEKYGKNIHSW